MYKENKKTKYSIYERYLNIKLKVKTINSRKIFTNKFGHTRYTILFLNQKRMDLNDNDEPFDRKMFVGIFSIITYFYNYPWESTELVNQTWL